MNCSRCRKNMTDKNGATLVAARMTITSCIYLSSGFTEEFLRQQLGRHFQTAEAPYHGDFCYECYIDSLMRC